jgi:hypothetical protein
MNPRHSGFAATIAALTGSRGTGDAGDALAAWRRRWANRPRRSWYRFGTDRCVHYVQIVHEPGLIGRSGRSRTHRYLDPLGWGPKGREFKSRRPDYRKARFRSRLFEYSEIGEPLLLVAQRRSASWESSGSGSPSPAGVSGAEQARSLIARRRRERIEFFRRGSSAWGAIARWASGERRRVPGRGGPSRGESDCDFLGRQPVSEDLPTSAARNGVGG